MFQHTLLGILFHGEFKVFCTIVQWRQEPYVNSTVYSKRDGNEKLFYQIRISQLELYVHKSNAIHLLLLF